MKSISSLFMRLAVVWFIAGVTLGLVMAASQNHSMAPVHAHINLLGWVTMTLFAAFYRNWPAAAMSPLARWHFWLYVPAHFVQMVTLAMLYAGMKAVEPVLGAASVVVVLAVVCFAVLVWRETGAEHAGRTMPGALGEGAVPGPR
ncbi:MAG TPA: hypothetical protein VLK85_07595 [Ramlibacter sp.]|nr:hypothetical protein [Ramlibacter sp.]